MSLFRDRLVTVRRLEQALAGLMQAEAYLRELGDEKEAAKVQKIRRRVDARLATEEERPERKREET